MMLGTTAWDQRKGEVSTGTVEKEDDAMRKKGVSCAICKTTFIVDIDNTHKHLKKN